MSFTITEMTVLEDSTSALRLVECRHSSKERYNLIQRMKSLIWTFFWRRISFIRTEIWSVWQIHSKRKRFPRLSDALTRVLFMHPFRSNPIGKSRSLFLLNRWLRLWWTVSISCIRNFPIPLSPMMFIRESKMYTVIPSQVTCNLSGGSMLRKMPWTMSESGVGLFMADSGMFAMVRGHGISAFPNTVLIRTEFSSGGEISLEHVSSKR